MHRKRKKLSFDVAEEDGSDDEAANDSNRNTMLGGSLRRVTDERFKEERESLRRYETVAHRAPGVPQVTSSMQAVHVVVGSHAVRGSRATMEDVVAEHTCCREGKELRMAGVFDGHNGPRASAFLGQRLLPAVASGLTSVMGTVFDEEDLRSTMVAAFKNVENELLITAGTQSFNDGSTACLLAVVGREHLVCANCGDSRVVLVSGRSAGRGSFPLQVERLSVDHKVESERERVIAAGGDLRFQGVWRVVIDHMAICVSRSFGASLPRGEALILCTPHVTVRPLRPEHTCVVLASDGLWDVVTDEQVGQIVCDALTRGRHARWTIESAKTCARALVEHAIAAQTRDNVAVSVVGFERD